MVTELGGLETVLLEEDKPPVVYLSPGDWMRQNLFNNWYNALITFLVGASFVAAVVFTLRWLLAADFQIVRTNLRVFMIGQFPRDELWRPWVSGFLLAGAGGLVSGAMWRNALEDAEEKGLPYPPHSWTDLLRRFWAIIVILLFFVSFARTLPPYIGLLLIFVTIYISREAGMRSKPALRIRVPFIGALLLLVSFIALAGTSGLGASSIGAALGWWTSFEIARRTETPTLQNTVTRWVSAIVVGVVAWLAVRAIGFEGFGWDDWGGIHLTLFVTVVGVSIGLPFGILLALGRQSKLRIIKSATVVFIEFVRGVPLITLLLFSTFLLPLFIPIGVTIPGPLTRAMIVITAFSAAYIAEIVRGGLQAVPLGQTEAAQASGMSVGAIQRLIVLPQALRAVIPAMVGQFISLFKDTSLLSVIGLLEFLQVSAVANAQTEFLGQGLVSVTYPFVALGYWAFAYTMSKESRRIEAKLGVGVR